MLENEKSQRVRKEGKSRQMKRTGDEENMNQNMCDQARLRIFYFILSRLGKCWWCFNRRSSLFYFILFMLLYYFIL